MDKDEISAEAARIGTFPISIIPDQDCCTLFTPRHPATRTRPEEIDAAETALSLEDLVTGAVEGPAVEDLRYPVLK
jgi:thiamine biosynthesis protein ThiI